MKQTWYQESWVWQKVNMLKQTKTRFHFYTLTNPWKKSKEILRKYLNILHNGIFIEHAKLYIDKISRGQEGPPGIGFKFTDDGNFDIRQKIIINSHTVLSDYLKYDLLPKNTSKTIIRAKSLAVISIRAITKQLILLTRSITQTLLTRNMLVTTSWK